MTLCVFLFFFGGRGFCDFVLCCIRRYHHVRHSIRQQNVNKCSIHTNKEREREREREREGGRERRCIDLQMHSLGGRTINNINITLNIAIAFSSCFSRSGE